MGQTQARHWLYNQAAGSLSQWTEMVSEYKLNWVQLQGSSGVSQGCPSVSFDLAGGWRSYQSDGWIPVMGPWTGIHSFWTEFRPVSQVAILIGQNLNLMIIKHFEYALFGTMLFLCGCCYGLECMPPPPKKYRWKPYPQYLRMWSFFGNRAHITS